MTITVGISCVDGAEETITTHSAERALKFLVARDHEGSAVGVTLTLETGEESYQLLLAAQFEQERQERNKA